MPPRGGNVRSRAGARIVGGRLTVWVGRRRLWGGGPQDGGGKTDGMAGPMSTPAPPRGRDRDEPIPDTPAELDEPELPAPPIESTPEDPGGDPGEEPAPV